MKDYYKIAEISKLYNIGVDSLRYYERLGVIKPHRDTNGYRLYDLKDMYKLTVIRNLRELDFSMAQIKEYLDGQSVENTLALLHQEQELLQQQLEKLQIRQQLLTDRIQTLQAAQQSTVGEIQIKTLPKRVCVTVNQHITRDEEMDFVIKKLHRKHEDKIRDLGNQLIGAFLSMEQVQQGVGNVYHSVFFVLDQEQTEYDFVFPAGEYACCCYRGGYEQNAACIQNMLAYLKEQNITVEGDAFELYKIDNRDTMRPEEFLTEIQIKVNAAAQS